MKTIYSSYTNKGICDGCKFCVKGEKLVLFMGGVCSRNCWYCSLSKNRKNSTITYANERPIKNTKELITEAKESNSKGAGITGGDPLINLNKTIKYVRALKKEFGKNFQTHIYLPLVLVNEKKLKRLKNCIDEVRFHPSFLTNPCPDLKKKEIEKIKLASKIFGIKNTGIELPIIPELKKEIYEFIKNLEGIIGFANLNELEISETNFEKITKEYSLNSDTYTIRNSVTAGKEVINKAKKDKLKINIHLCTAKTKDCYQYINRLLKHDILPFANRLEDGSVVYFCVYPENLKIAEKEISPITKKYFIDKKNKRIILDFNSVLKVYEKSTLKIARVVEHPTFGSERLEYSVIGE